MEIIRTVILGLGSLALVAAGGLAFRFYLGRRRDDVAYIMDTFPIVKRKDKAAHGEYRTRRVILGIYDAMQQAIETGPPYQTLLDPPPADPRVAHGKKAILNGP